MIILKRTILVVDDDPIITNTLSKLISAFVKCKVLVSNNPKGALRIEELIYEKVDMIISDFLMPEMNGLEFLTNAKQLCPEAIMIMLTGYADKESAIKSVNEVGLYYYLEKPWDNQQIIKIIENGLEKKELDDKLKRKMLELEASNNELSRLYELTKKNYLFEVENGTNLVIALANIIEAKDKYTDGHARRVAEISRRIGTKMDISEYMLRYIEVGGIIHDIGKIGIPDILLNKKGKLTEEEFEIVKKHPIIGEKICKPLTSLKQCVSIVGQHHEKLDGSGYPYGLKGDEISIEARIVSAADIFDGLYTKRPYKDRLALIEVKDIMKKDAEMGLIDKEIVSALFEVIEEKSVIEMYNKDI